MSEQKEQLSEDCNYGNHTWCNPKPHIICNCECHEKDKKNKGSNFTSSSKYWHHMGIGTLTNGF